MPSEARQGTKKTDVRQMLEFSTKYSPIAQSVEHMTVNHGVVGSSPTGGAIYGRVSFDTLPFFFLISLRWKGRFLFHFDRLSCDILGWFWGQGSFESDFIRMHIVGRLCEGFLE